MIEQIIEIIVRELGPVGILVVGLYFCLNQPLRKMAHSLEVINKETGEVRDAIRDLTYVLKNEIK